MGCIHRPVSAQDAVWLPPDDKKENHTPAQKRIFCLGCGSVKYQGSDKAKRIGFFTNLMSKINQQIIKEHRRGVKGLRRITEVQKRLMVREMEADEIFSDNWISTHKLQVQAFKRLLKRHCPMFTDSLIEAAYARK